MSRALVGLREELVGLPDQPTFTGGIGMKAAREAAGQRAAAKRAATEEARPETAADEATVVAAQVKISGAGSHLGSRVCSRGGRSGVRRR